MSKPNRPGIDAIATGIDLCGEASRAGRRIDLTQIADRGQIAVQSVQIARYDG